MPNSVIVKIVLARKRQVVLSLIVLFCIGATVAVVLMRHGYSRVTAQIGTHAYRLEVADTMSTRELGLGNRPSLPTDQGMLFSFSHESVQCFWMKDMQFPLDIIWLDRGKRVVHIAHDVTPASYPRNYCPSNPAQYVIELNAGQASRATVQKGQALTF
ncbi:MAG TPA: DUF192 domain-containing protein [Patescibacteria group bacterium]|nr:DUF192 domain-containing protein [Patescibacteria group bacterium]